MKNMINKSLSTVWIILFMWSLSSCNVNDLELSKEIPYIPTETAGVYEGDVIPNEECAKAVASAIYDHMEKSGNAESYIPQYVIFDEENDVWIVSFWEESDTLFFGGDCNIAIQKKDGKVLSIWYGE